jgi:hypothetical protein
VSKTESLVSSTRISATSEAHKCYDLLCGARQIDAQTAAMRKELFGDPKRVIFSDTVQAFYVAAVVGHFKQEGKRPKIEGKAKEGLILLQHWERQEKKDLRKALTFLVKLEYGAKDPKEVLQIVAELAEVGIREIKDKVVQTGDTDFFDSVIEFLRKETDKKGPLLE